MIMIDKFTSDELTPHLTAIQAFTSESLSSIDAATLLKILKFHQEWFRNMASAVQIAQLATLIYQRVLDSSHDKQEQSLLFLALACLASKYTRLLDEKIRGNEKTLEETLEDVLRKDRYGVFWPFLLKKYGGRDRFSTIRPIFTEHFENPEQNANEQQLKTLPSPWNPFQRFVGVRYCPCISQGQKWYERLPPGLRDWLRAVFEGPVDSFITTITVGDRSIPFYLGGALNNRQMAEMERASGVTRFYIFSLQTPEERRRPSGLPIADHKPTRSQPIVDHTMLDARTGQLITPATIMDQLQEVEKALASSSSSDAPYTGLYIHCRGGQGRSVVLGILFLVYQKGLSLNEAYSLILRQRPNIEKKSRLMHDDVLARTYLQIMSTSLEDPNSVQSAIFAQPAPLKPNEKSISQKLQDDLILTLRWMNPDSVTPDTVSQFMSMVQKIAEKSKKEPSQIWNGIISASFSSTKTIKNILAMAQKIDSDQQKIIFERLMNFWRQAQGYLKLNSSIKAFLTALIGTSWIQHETQEAAKRLLKRWKQRTPADGEGIEQIFSGEKKSSSESSIVSALPPPLNPPPVASSVKKDPDPVGLGARLANFFTRQSRLPGQAKPREQEDHPMPNYFARWRF